MCAAIIDDRLQTVLDQIRARLTARGAGSAVDDAFGAIGSVVDSVVGSAVAGAVGCGCGWATTVAVQYGTRTATWAACGRVVGRSMLDFTKVIALNQAARLEPSPSQGSAGWAGALATIRSTLRPYR